MTRQSLALILTSVFNTLRADPYVNECAYEHGLLSRKSHDVISLRQLERLPKLSLCVIMKDIVEVGKESPIVDVLIIAHKVDTALFSIDPPFKGGFDSLLNSRTTPKPVLYLLTRK